MSYHDGAHWTPVPTAGTKALTAMLPPAPVGATFASIRVTANDSAGNQIDQTITRAWKLAQ